MSAKRFGVRVHAIAECAVGIPSACASRCEGFVTTAVGVCNRLSRVGKGSVFCTFTAYPTLVWITLQEEAVSRMMSALKSNAGRVRLFIDAVWERLTPAQLQAV